MSGMNQWAIGDWVSYGHLCDDCAKGAMCFYARERARWREEDYLSRGDPYFNFCRRGEAQVLRHGRYGVKLRMPEGATRWFTIEKMAEGKEVVFEDRLLAHIRRIGLHRISCMKLPASQKSKAGA